MKFRSELQNCSTQLAATTICVVWQKAGTAVSALVAAPCSCQPKVTDLQVTRGIKKKIAGLQISV